MSGEKIFIVDDDKNVRRSLQVALNNEGYETHVFVSPVDVMKVIEEEIPDVFILDVCMGELSGIDLYQKLKKIKVEAPVIFISGESDVGVAVKAVQEGAFDFIEKPFRPERLAVSIRRCLDYCRLQKEVLNFKTKTDSSDFIGQSSSFKKLVQVIHKVARTNTAILITGESGSGKELVAREIHSSSKQSGGPFVKVNCAAIPENLIESELFGYVKGAFTGADRNKKGFFEQANGGTLFLDEIGEMSLSAQAKVLRVLQSMEMQKVGSEVVQSVNVRVLAATNRDLEVEVKSGNFREDLLYRINVFPISTPPLRERKKDIPILVNYFLENYTRQNELIEKRVSSLALDKLMDYSWPGNVRELKNVVERMAILGGQTLDESHLVGLKPLEGSTLQDENLSLKEYKNKVERQYIVKTLNRTSGNISEAASLLKIERTYLHKKIQTFDIKKKEYFV